MFRAAYKWYFFTKVSEHFLSSLSSDQKLITFLFALHAFFTLRINIHSNTHIHSHSYEEFKLALIHEYMKMYSRHPSIHVKHIRMHLFFVSHNTYVYVHLHDARNYLDLPFSNLYFIRCYFHFLILFIQ